MQRSLLRLLALAHRENLDPSGLVANLAEEHRGRFRHLLQRLSRRLSEGTPLISALEQTPDVLSDRDVLLLRFAIQTGTLTQTYERLLSGHRSRLESRSEAIKGSLVYPCVALIVACGLCTFLAIFIFPKLMQVFQDFGLALPDSFQSLVTAARTISEYAPLLGLLVILPFILSYSTSVRRFCRRLFTPLVKRNIVRAQSADLLDMLAAAGEAGRPIPATLSMLARYHFDPYLRNKLLFVRNEVEQGADIWSSLAEANLLSEQEADALGKLTRKESRIWTMRRLAEDRHERAAMHERRSIATIEPMLVLVIAAAVLWIGVGILGPLSDLTLHVAYDN